jgi:3-deoxy-D-arabino-heptulosonate 7-phosphate (DAHP) synthase
VEDPDKGDLRNFPVHQTVRRIKQANPTLPIYFDPSHVFGSKMKFQIVPQTILAMQMKTNNGQFLYDGLLIEVGTSQSDTGQHLSLDELDFLIHEIARFRPIKGR